MPAPIQYHLNAETFVLFSQVIQSAEGPRIVLQGIQGSDFTASQLAAVQTQVKQQLLKGKRIPYFL